MSSHAQLRLVHVRCPARRLVLGRAQSDDVSVLRVADNDDVAGRARREPAFDERCGRVKRALRRRGWSKMEASAADARRTRSAAVAGSDAADVAVHSGHQLVLLRGFRGCRASAVHPEHWLLSAAVRCRRRLGEQVPASAGTLAVPQQSISVLDDDAAGDVTRAEDVDTQR